MSPDDPRQLVLRTVGPEMTSYSNGTRWPETGPVEVDPGARTPHLSGFLWGLATVREWVFVLNMTRDFGRRWQVVAVAEADFLPTTGHARFVRGEVVYTGERDGAIELLVTHAPAGTPVPWATIEGGEGVTVRVGHWGTAIAGEHGRAIAGDFGHARAGRHGYAAAGEGGTITLATLASNVWSDRTWRVGENGVRPNWLHESRGIADPAPLWPAQTYSASVATPSGRGAAPPAEADGAARHPRREPTGFRPGIGRKGGNGPTPARLRPRNDRGPPP